MRSYGRRIAAGIAGIALVVLFWPRTANDQPPGEQTPEGKMSSAFEIQYKQQMLEQDLQLTEQLCRNQCKLSIQNIITNLEKNPEAGTEQLAVMQRRHPHMQYIEASNGKSTMHQGKQEDLPEEVRPYVDLARESAMAKREYESPRIYTDEGPYLVTAVPSSTNAGYVLSAVKQHILDQVHIEQRKNLRIVPYPSDERYGIQAADSDTLRKVEVDHPEENEDISHYYKHDIVVRFIKQPTEEMLAEISRQLTAEVKNQSGDAYIFHSQKYTMEQMRDYFMKHHEIRYAEPHYLYVTNAAPPNDALYSQYQWNLPAIHTETGWDLAEQGNEVIVAVVDTGVDLNHPDLTGRLTEGYNVYTQNADAMDDVGHGTHVAGIIAARINNYEGIAGLTPNARIMPVKVLDASGAGSTYAVAQGIIWAADHGADVINLSLGNYAQSDFLHDAIRYAYERDIVLVAATGNDFTESPGYPAAYPEVFAVGASDYNQQLAQFSNYGSYVDAAAPGVSIASTYPGSQYAALSGTSMASPHAAALAAMIRGLNPDLTNEQIMELMRATCVDLGDPGHDIYYGYGQIDIAGALQTAVNGGGQSLVNWSTNLERGITRIISRYE